MIRRGGVSSNFACKDVQRQQALAMDDLRTWCFEGLYFLAERNRQHRETGTLYSARTETTMRTPVGYGELILYLDFDGVLHHANCLWHPRVGAYLSAPDGYVLFQHAELLEEILTPYPEVRIVLSTSWVRVYGCTKAAKNLRPSLRQRVIGATFHSQMDKQAFTEAPRGVQVLSDVMRRKPKDWIAIDDDHRDWPAACLDKYVRTHEHEGISEPTVLAELKLKLVKMCGRDKPL